MMAYTRTHGEARSVAVTKARAWCGTAVVPGLPPVQKAWELKAIQQRSKKSQSINLWGFHCPGRLRLGGNRVRSYLLVFATLTSQGMRHKPRSGSKPKPCVHAGLPRAPRPRAREKIPGRRRKVQVFREIIHLISTSIHAYMVAHTCADATALPGICMDILADILTVRIFFKTHGIM